MKKEGLSRQAIISIVFVVLGFAVSVTSVSTSTINGVVSCSFMNYGALGFGVLAAVSSVIGLMGLSSVGERHRNLSMIILALCLIVAVFHILRGMGIVGGPCG